MNPATEGDPRLEDAAVSTVVQSDVPIVSERSMYWSEDGINFGEGHNSSGLASTATRWGLAEGRLGGPRQFDTFILLANPTTTEAQVTITYLRESGAPIVKTYTVRADEPVQRGCEARRSGAAGEFVRRADRGDQQRADCCRTVAVLERQRRVVGGRQQRTRHGASLARLPRGTGAQDAGVLPAPLKGAGRWPCRPNAGLLV